MHHGLDNYGRKLELCKLLNGNCPTSVHWIIVYTTDKRNCLQFARKNKRSIATVLNVAESIMNSQWQLQQPMTAVHKKGSRRAAASGGIFKNLL
jgi:hypothetical protein